MSDCPQPWARVAVARLLTAKAERAAARSKNAQSGDPLVEYHSIKEHEAVVLAEARCLVAAKDQAVREIREAAARARASAPLATDEEIKTMVRGLIETRHSSGRNALWPTTGEDAVAVAEKIRSRMEGQG